MAHIICDMQPWLLAAAFGGNTLQSAIRCRMMTLVSVAFVVAFGPVGRIWFGSVPAQHNGGLRSRPRATGRKKGCLRNPSRSALLLPSGSL